MVGSGPVLAQMRGRLAEMDLDDEEVARALQPSFSFHAHLEEDVEAYERLGVSPSQVSRDERNDYHGVSVERAQRVLEALGLQIRVEVTGMSEVAA